MTAKYVVIVIRGEIVGCGVLYGIAERRRFIPSVLMFSFIF